MLALELREAFLLPEKPRVGVVEVAKSHLERLGVDVLQPRTLFFQLDKLVNEMVAGEGVPSGLICLRLLFERTVVYEPTSPEMLFEHVGLLPGGLDSILVRSQHVVCILRFLYNHLHGFVEDCVFLAGSLSPSPTRGEVLPLAPYRFAASWLFYALSAEVVSALASAKIKSRC